MTLKIYESQKGAGNQYSCQVVKLSSCQVVKIDPWDNFCFHVYAQKCQVVKFDPLGHAEQLLYSCPKWPFIGYDRIRTKLKVFDGWRV